MKIRFRLGDEDAFVNVWGLEGESELPLEGDENLNLLSFLDFELLVWDKCTGVHTGNRNK